MNTKQLQCKRPLPEDFDKEEVFCSKSSKKVKGSASSKNGNHEASPSQLSVDQSISKEKAAARKPVFPLIIRKYFNSKGKMKIEEAINQLETPLEKFHRKKLRQMKLLGASQEKEIQGEIMLRKKYNLVEGSHQSNHTSTMDEFSTAILSPEAGESVGMNWSAENWSFDDEFQTVAMDFKESVIENPPFSDSEQTTWENEQFKEHHQSPIPSNFERDIDAPLEEFPQPEFDPVDYSFPHFAPSFNQIEQFASQEQACTQDYSSSQQQHQEMMSLDIPVKQQQQQQQPNSPVSYEQKEGSINFELSKSQSLANDQLQQISNLLHSKNQGSIKRPPLHNSQMGYFGVLPIAPSFEVQRYQNYYGFAPNGYLNYGNNPFNGNSFPSMNFQTGHWALSHHYQSQPIA